MKRFSAWVENNQKVNLLNISGYDSISLYKEMAVTNPNIILSLEKALQWISDHKIACVIIGGTVVEHYISGSRENKSDLDFLVANIELLKQQLATENIKFSNLALISGFRGIYVPDLDADFIDAHSGNVLLHTLILKTANTERIGGVPFPVISPEALTIMKLLPPGRDKDINDAMNLLNSGMVNKAKFISAVKNLKPMIDKIDPDEYESFMQYASLIK